MRKAVIDLDWLDSEIERYRKKEQDALLLVKLRGRFNLEGLMSVLSKCTPIEEAQLGTIKESAWSFGFIGMETIGKAKETFLSKTCINNWEDKKFCENTGKCELCKIKQ